MWMLLIVIGLFILAEIVLIARFGLVGLILPYVIGTGIWIFYPGYDSGFASWLLTNVIVVGLAALGQIFPGGAAGVAGAGVGGFFLGRWISRM